MNLHNFFKNRKFQKQYENAIDKLNGNELLEIGYRAYEYYIKTVKGRENCTQEEARKVLTRNIILSIDTMEDMVEEFQLCKVFQYGNLSIKINELKSKIIGVRNHYTYNEFVVDLEYKEFLNKKLGIIDVGISERKVS